MNEIMIMKVLQSLGNAHQLGVRHKHVGFDGPAGAYQMKRIFSRMILKKDHDVPILHPWRDHAEWLRNGGYPKEW